MRAFADLVQLWIDRQQITRSQAMARLGTNAVYDYVQGIRLPQRRLIPDLAARMGLPVAEVQAAVESDRAARQGAAEPAEPAAADPTTAPAVAGATASPAPLENW